MLSLTKQILPISVINDLPIFGKFLKKTIIDIEPVFTIYMPNPNNNDDDDDDDDDNKNKNNKNNKKN